MAKSKAKSVRPYVEQLLEDEFVQEQLRDALSAARAAYARARTQRIQVVEDKGAYRNLRQAATALRRASQALGPVEPQPKHGGRKFAMFMLGVAATAVVTIKLQKRYSEERADSAASASRVKDATAAARDPTRVQDPARAGWGT
jgi:hypothetical protein